MAIKLPIVSSFDQSGLKQAQGALKGFGKQLGGLAVALGAAFSVRAISNFAKESVLVAEAAATAQARLQAVAEATGVFGAETSAVTARLAEFAKTQEMRIAVDDKVIKGVQAQLLSFKALAGSADETGGAFDRATQSAFDMAAAGFGSAESNAIALGKALEDPIRGVTALRRTGTTFTEQQLEQIKVLQESGDLLGAQELILGELESQYGGVAAATADASDKIALSFENIKETVGAVLLPIFADLVEELQPVLETIGEELADALEDLQPVIKDVAKAIPGLIKMFAGILPVVVDLAGLFFEFIKKILPPLTKMFQGLMPVIQRLLPPITNLISRGLDVLMDVVFMLIKAFGPLVDAVLPLVMDLVKSLAPIVIDLIRAFMPLIREVVPILTQLLRMLIPIMTQVAQIVSQVLVGAITGMTSVIRAVAPVLADFSRGFMNVFSTVTTFVTNNVNAVIGAFNKFASSFRSVFNSIRGFFSGILNGMTSMFRGFVNGVISALNSMIRGMNRISFRAPSWVPFIGGRNFGISIPQIPMLAEGGIVTGPTLAMIGEAGPEAVIPLSGRNAGMGNTYNITVNAGMGTSGSEVGRKVVDMIKAYERTSGKVFASA